MRPCCAPCLPKAANVKVTLDVGGHRYTSVKSTLTTGRGANSALVDLLNGPCEEDGSYFLDRDGLQFLFIMNYLRYGPGAFVAPESRTARLTLVAEAKMLRLPGLVELLENSEPSLPVSPNPNSYALTEEDTYFGAPIPKNEAERIAKLRSLDVMDTKNSDTEYDLITRISAAIIGTPIVLVSLVAEDKQWFKSRCGLEANETSRASSFCAYTLVSTDLADAHVLIVTDARRDLRFMRNPLVLGEPYIQFYCGVPLITSEGLRMGSLCCIDSKPRDISPKELGLQINFGYLTSQALESKYLEEQNSQEPREGISKEEEHFLGGRLRAEAMCDFGRTAICLVWARPDSMDWPLMYGSKVWTELTGVEVIPPSKFPGQAVIRSEVGKTWPAILGSGESFWDYARMASRDSQSILELWKVVLQAMQGERQDSKPGFAILVSLKSPRSSSVSKLLSCRFTPAEMPLGEGAAVVKNHGLAHSTEKWPHPKGFAADGHWFFIQMVPEKEANLPEIQSPRPCPPDSPGQSETPSLKVFRDDEPLTTKPPTPPFQDVRLVRLVGQGSFGCVYFSLWSGAAVACKVIKTVITKKNQKDLEELTAKPHFEAILSLRISHPNLVQTFKHGERALELKKAQKVYETWIVQEWCDGGTLQSICNEARMEGKRLLESLEIFLEISRAGQYLHEIGLIHGDLTSNNILLKSMPISKGFICKVCDFGLCRILGDDSEEIKTNSLGTLSYMPPEVLQSQDHSLTRKTDVYSLGMIVWIVLTGKAPYPGLTAPQVVIQVSRGKRPVLPENLPEDLLAAFRSTLAESPESRPNFSELVDQFSKMYKDLGGMDDDEAFLIETQAEKYRASQSAPNTLDNKT